MSRTLVRLLAGMLIISCAGLSPTGSPHGTPIIVASASASEAVLGVTVERERVIAWSSGAGPQVVHLVVAEVVNDSPSWIKVDAFASTYTVYSADRTQVADGFFLYAYPDYIAPGDTGFLIERAIDQAGPPPALYADVLVKLAYGASGPPPWHLSTAASGIRAAGAGVEAFGTLINDGQMALRSGHLAAVFEDGAGVIIGASTTNLIAPLAPGQQAEFETLVSNPLEISRIASFRILAAPD